MKALEKVCWYRAYSTGELERNTARIRVEAFNHSRIVKHFLVQLQEDANILYFIFLSFASIHSSSLSLFSSSSVSFSSLSPFLFLRFGCIHQQPTARQKYVARYFFISAGFLYIQTTMRLLENRSHNDDSRNDRAFASRISRVSLYCRKNFYPKRKLKNGKPKQLNALLLSFFVAFKKFIIYSNNSLLNYAL